MDGYEAKLHDLEEQYFVQHPEMNSLKPSMYAEETSFEPDIGSLESASGLENPLHHRYITNESNGTIPEEREEISDIK